MTLENVNPGNENKKTRDYSKPWWKKPIIIIGILTLLAFIISIYISIDQDFKISCIPMDGSVNIGHQVNSKISISGNKYDYPVKLSSVGSVDGMLITFNPPIGKADIGYESVMNISVNKYVPAKNYLITIIASGADGTTHTCKYELDVTVPLLPQDVFLDGMFFPDGFMGDFHDIDLDYYSTNYPHSGSNCIEISYSAKKTGGFGWAGIYWLYPNNNWGNFNESRNLRGAKFLRFWGRASHDGVQAEFKVGGIQGKFSESIQPAKSTGLVNLSTNWEEYYINLSDENLSIMFSGFCWTTNVDQNPSGCKVYLDDIRFTSR